jgi:hypothetical protein
MNVGIGTVAAQFLSWESLFRNFGIVCFAVRGKLGITDLQYVTHLQVLGGGGGWKTFCKGFARYYVLPKCNRKGIVI